MRTATLVLIVALASCQALVGVTATAAAAAEVVATVEVVQVTADKLDTNGTPSGRADGVRDGSPLSACERLRRTDRCRPWLDGQARPTPSEAVGARVGGRSAPRPSRTCQRRARPSSARAPHPKHRAPSPSTPRSRRGHGQGRGGAGPVPGDTGELSLGARAIRRRHHRAQHGSRRARAPPAGANATPMLRMESVGHFEVDGRGAGDRSWSDRGRREGGVRCAHVAGTAVQRRHQARRARDRHKDPHDASGARRRERDNKLAPGMFAECSGRFDAMRPRVRTIQRQSYRRPRRPTRSCPRRRDRAGAVQRGTALKDRVEVVRTAQAGDLVLSRGSEELRTGRR